MPESISQAPLFRVCCLGGFKIVEAAGGADVTPASRKARALIGYLCIAAQPVAREKLAALFWGDRGDEQARASLRQTIYEVRSLPGGDHLLKLDRDTVAIGERVDTDVAGIISAAGSGNLDALGTALAAWHGEFFEDLPSFDPSFDTWLAAERLRVKENLIDAAVKAAEAGIAAGEIERARRIVRILEQRDGSSEAVLRLGLRLDHLAGDSAALHRRYERFCALLKSELGVAPSAESQRLFRDLAANEKAPEPAAVVSHPEIGRRIGNSNRDASFARLPADPAAAFPPHAPGKSVSRGPGLMSRKFGIAAAAFMIVALAMVAWLSRYPAQRPPPLQQPLLAVLPFQNPGGDAGSRYFSDGMTEEIVDAVLRTTQIRVVSTSSSFLYRAAGLPAAARALSATHILSGSITHDGNRIHVIAQLMKVADNRVLWSQSYDRDIAQSPVLQRDIATQIADALDMRISESALEDAQHVDPIAYDHYLKGRDLLLQRDLEAAVAELEVSVRADPRFAKAWSTLAVALATVAAYASNEHKDIPSAKQAAQSATRRALALDPGDAEALGVKAFLMPFARKAEAEQLYGRALLSEPNNSQVLNWYSRFLQSVGRNSEAVDVSQRDYALDRVTPSIALNLARALLETGRFERAREIIDLNRDSRLRNYFFALHAEYFLFRSDWAGLAGLLNNPPDSLSPRDMAFFSLCRETALALAARNASAFPLLRERWRSETAADMDDAVQYLAALGDSDGALTLLQSVMQSEKDDDYSTYPEWDALFAPNLAALRHDPRVPALLAQWGLFDYWRTTGHWPDFCGEAGLPFDCKAEALKRSRPSAARAGL